MIPANPTTCDPQWLPRLRLRDLGKLFSGSKIGTVLGYIDERVVVYLNRGGRAKCLNEDYRKFLLNLYGEQKIVCEHWS